VIIINLKERCKMIGKRKPTHPGEVLREDVIKPLGLTVTDVARQLGVTRKTLSALLNCKASLSPESWLYMQAKLDLWAASRTLPKVKELKAAV
jgi:plasmid maintenance system antidote protein VapI